MMLKVSDFLVFAPLAALARSASAASLPHNQLPKLVPEQGAWRGSTLGPQFRTDSNDSVGEFNRAYPDTPLHLYRQFSDTVTPEVREWVAKGNILWYNVAGPGTSWQAGARGDFDEHAEVWAQAVKSLAPANVFVVIGHEADHNLCFNTNSPCDNGHPAGNTPANYRAMWARIQAVFAAQKVTNAVWAMDYSTNIGSTCTLVDLPCEDNSCRPASAVAPLWPGDDRIDWVFYNLFEKGKNGKRVKETYTEMQEESYYQVLSKITSASPGCASGKCDLASKPWGVGAMGTKGPGNSEVPTDLRAQFFKDLVSGLEAGDYPKLKAYIYYDSRDSAVDHQNATDIVNVAFMEYLASPTFTLNDSPSAAVDSLHLV